MKLPIYNNILNISIIVILIVLWIFVNGKCALFALGVISFLFFVNLLVFSTIGVLHNTATSQINDSLWRVIYSIVSSVCLSYCFFG